MDSMKRKSCYCERGPTFTGFHAYAVGYVVNGERRHVPRETFHLPHILTHSKNHNADIKLSPLKMLLFQRAQKAQKNIFTKRKGPKVRT